MIEINRDKAQKIINLILDCESKFDRDTTLSDADAVKKIKKIVEEVVDAITID